MLSVPGAKTVRGYSFFGDSFVYVLFEDGTDLYWARSRVLEYLGQVQSRLPPGAQRDARPRRHRRRLDLQYALVDRSGRHDLGQLRALQDWFLKYELKAVPNVAEVAVGRRHGAAVPGGARPRPAARLRPHPRPGGRGDPARQPGRRRLGARARRGRVHGARRGLPAVARRLPPHPARRHRRRRVGAAGRRGAAADRPRDAPRHRRARRRGRGRRRGDRHAQRQERAARPSRRCAASCACCRPGCPRASRSCRPTTARS